MSRIEASLLAEAAELRTEKRLRRKKKNKMEEEGRGGGDEENNKDCLEEGIMDKFLCCINFQTLLLGLLA